MKTLLIIFFLFCSTAKAKTYLAFFEFYDYHGNLIQVEDGGRFSHVAISNGEFWLHAHPGKGKVEAVDSIKEMNFYKAKVFLFENDSLNLSSNALREYVDVTYDRDFDWSNRTLYNAELIALILGIAPSPMNFNANFWQKNSAVYPSGNLGLSPDDIFSELDNLGFQSADY
jgi:hypothetical protein